MVKFFNTDNRRAYVFYQRKLIDNLLHHIAFEMGEPKAEYWNPRNKKQLKIKPFIKGIGYWDNDEKAYVFTWGLPAYEEKHHIGYNSIVSNACLSVFEICSDCGVHDISKAIDLESLNTDSLSIYTMQSLLNQICDVICWYDKALELIKGIH
jgi:hypothetical protein